MANLLPAAEPVYVLQLHFFMGSGRMAVVLCGIGGIDLQGPGDTACRTVQ